MLKQWFIGACIFFSGLMVMGCQAQNVEMDTELPLASMNCTVAKGTQERFAENLDKFSKQYEFAFRVGHPTPNAQDLTVQLWREDMKILATNPFDAEEFQIDIYANDKNAPTSAAVTQLMQNLQASLKNVGDCRDVPNP